MLQWPCIPLPAWECQLANWQQVGYHRVTLPIKYDSRGLFYRVVFLNLIIKLKDYLSWKGTSQGCLLQHCHNDLVCSQVKSRLSFGFFLITFMFSHCVCLFPCIGLRNTVNRGGLGKQSFFLEEKSPEVLAFSSEKLWTLNCWFFTLCGYS